MCRKCCLFPLHRAPLLLVISITNIIYYVPTDDESGTILYTDCHFLQWALFFFSFLEALLLFVFLVTTFMHMGPNVTMKHDSRIRLVTANLSFLAKIMLKSVLPLFAITAVCNFKKLNYEAQGFHPFQSSSEVRLPVSAHLHTFRYSSCFSGWKFFSASKAKRMWSSMMKEKETEEKDKGPEHLSQLGPYVPI